MNRKAVIWVLVTLVSAVLAWYLAVFAPGESHTVREGTVNGARLAELLGSNRPEGYAVADAHREFSFPRDHGPHPDYRNEWWYLTGNLQDEDGRRFGYEFTLFRFSLAPGNHEPSDSSSWKTNQVFIADFAVTDASNEKFHVEQRVARGALGLAGAQSHPFRAWIEDWSIAQDPGAVATESSRERWILDAASEELGLNLKLRAVKPVVLNGIEGLSRKSDQPGNASWYYSIPRLDSVGELRIGDRTFRVSGSSWLDREWSSSALANDQQGWDWFALQLSDGSDLMFYNLRKTDGSQDRHSAGTWTDAHGRSHHLVRDDVIIRVVDTWESPRGGIYPARWELEVPSLGLEVTISPLVADQELVTTVRYWEGAVDVDGNKAGMKLSGRGYVELTGYDES